MPPISTVGAKGSQGAGVAGTQGIGLGTPIAAAVAYHSRIGEAGAHPERRNVGKRDVILDRCRWPSKRAPLTTWRGMSAFQSSILSTMAHSAYHEICIPLYKLCIEFSVFTGNQ
jgi:hypothetical protein